MTQYKSAGDIPGEAKTAVVDLLYRLGDDDLMIGHRHSEWTGLAPILEADIAFSSIAQDQMGQALAYYRLLHELGEPDPDTLAFTRGPDQYRCASLTVLEKGDWAFSTVRQFFYDVAKSLRLAELRDSTYVPLAQLARKLRGEQKYHLMHAQMWVSRLGDATEQSHQRMQGAVDELYGHALGLFEPTELDDAIATCGIGPLEGVLCEKWQNEANKMLADSGLSVPQDPKPVYGGRTGKHPKALEDLLDDMKKVYRLDPTATW